MSISFTEIFNPEKYKRVYVRSRDAFGNIVGTYETDYIFLYIVHLDEFERLYLSIDEVEVLQDS